jgi:hypothetical protein
MTLPVDSPARISSVSLLQGRWRALAVFLIVIHGFAKTLY